jgi:hypothetical protein
MTLQRASRIPLHHPRVVGLDLLVPGDTWENQLPATAEAGKVVMPNRADGHHTRRIDHDAAQPNVEARLEFADESQGGVLSAPVLNCSHVCGQRPEERVEGRLRHRGMSAQGHDHGDPGSRDTGRQRSIEHHGQHLSECGKPRPIRNHDRQRRTPDGKLRQWRACLGLIDRAGDDRPAIRSSPRSRGSHRTHPELAKVHRARFVPKRKFDNHPVTIPSCS